MKFFIKVENGLPVDHPIKENNFKIAFPDIDINNLPENFMEFERIQPPEITVFQKINRNYELVNGKYKDVYTVEELSSFEKNKILDELRDAPHIDLWEFDESLPGYRPGNLHLDSEEPEVLD
jgi:hypothetical protein